MVVFLLVAAAVAAFPVFSGHLYDWTAGSSAGFYLTMGLLFMAAACAFLAFWIGVAGLFGRNAPAMVTVSKNERWSRETADSRETRDDLKKAA